MSLLPIKITNENSISGVGLHSGKESRVGVFLEKDVFERAFFSKIVFTPLNNFGDFIEISPYEVGETVYSTDLIMAGSKRANRVSTVEHIMAALWALNIQKGFVAHTGEEIPIMDGSARPFIEYISGVISHTQTMMRPRPAYAIKETISVQNGDSFLSISPSDKFSVDITIDFPYPSIGIQNYSEIITQAKFINEIAHCRTFAHLNEVTYLKMMGKALGGSFDNAIVVDDKKVLNPEGLRDPKEFVKHKTLDLIGDLYLLGRPLLGHITGYKPGHKINNLLAREIHRRVIEEDDYYEDEIYA
jgi:UDP-3-O-[3-hydroxymyristoyl] N-acetylglucosamine deacetylase